MSITQSLSHGLAQIDQLTGGETELIAWGLGLCVAILILGFMVRSHKKSKALHNKLERLQHDLLVANNSAIGMGQKIIALEKQLYTHSTDSHLDQMAAQKMTQQTSQKTLQKPLHKTSQKVRPKTQAKADQEKPKLTLVDKTSLNQAEQDGLPDDAVYATTRELLAKGVDINEVVKRSGLSFSEVSLMQSLVK